jgi:hypothetical protein
MKRGRKEGRTGQDRTGRTGKKVNGTNRTGQDRKRKDRTGQGKGKERN